MMMFLTMIYVFIIEAIKFIKNKSFLPKYQKKILLRDFKMLIEVNKKCII